MKNFYKFLKSITSAKDLKDANINLYTFYELVDIFNTLRQHRKATTINTEAFKVLKTFSGLNVFIKSIYYVVEIKK